ncbi:cell division protein FtsQ/DivIB [[Haemophilus] ducreyi]|uniref:cell division protein FtsQ/DivIB n=1 Tax=Haemophilus ducreyi TaxID=730 RepID=UPI0006562A7B|nr:cell division protein FtsQ/DivIB [[Haemophilus] ducreyi]AKO45250.1 cell division protein FtsQ [[Haemophilus] ducreyi]AKO46652.1 cell division protein FtsQ [[Haemophilus] ducreyi]AKO47993.1 cell division protein FtsQ [[Haemophilus] ducreyi]AKO49381.1 cell division protein FtsQ [[Haemophilus] ducreyi]ANF61581.1 cell division protein FtsQ [[Haemophilus] ducreyi]
MVSSSRKKTTSSVRFKPSYTKSTASFNRLVFINPLIMLLLMISGFFIYTPWQSWLESLDKTPIRSFALTHKTRFTHNADIREKLSIEPALKGYFGQDIQLIKQKLLEMPWVKDTIVHKLYPDRLSITLLEHNPVALWNNSQLLSDQGIVFSVPKGRIDKNDLPILYGPDTEGKIVLDAWNKIKADLKARNLDLYSVMVDKRGSWTIKLSNNIELRLGRGKWSPKIDRFVTIFPEIDIPEGQKLAYVDLRYEHGAAVGFIPINK